MCEYHETMLSDVDAFRRRLADDVAAGSVTDDTLTTGYAHALELDAERKTYDRTLDALLARGDERGAASAMRCRRALRNGAARLRDALASARPRQGGGSPLRGPSPGAS